MPPDPLPLDVLLQPAAQPGPVARQRLVGQLDHPVVDGDQPGVHQQLHDRPVLLVVDHAAGEPARAPAGQRVVVARWRHQSHHQVPHQGLLGRRDAAVDLFGGAGDGTLDAAGGDVPRHRQGGALAVAPRLAQRVGEEGERAGLVLHLAQQEVDESGLEQQPGLLGGALDAGAQLLDPERAQQEEAALDHLRELRMGGEVAGAVRAHGHHQRAPPGVLGQGPEEPRALLLVGALRERLLALVHHQHVASPDRQPGQGVHRACARSDDHRSATVAAERGRQAGPDQGRLPAPRRSDDDEGSRFGESAQTGGDGRLATEEPVVVVQAVGRQALVGARRARVGPWSLGQQRGVLTQDGLLERDQVRSGVERQLGRQHRPHLAKGAQGLGLPAGLVLREGQERPSPLTQRRLGDESAGRGEDLETATGPQSRLEAELLDVASQLVEPGRLGPAVLPAVEVAQRCASPQRGRWIGVRPRVLGGLAEHVRRALRLPSASSSRPRCSSLSKRTLSTASARTSSR